MTDIEREELIDEATNSIQSSPSSELLKRGNEITKLLVNEDDTSKFDDLKKMFLLNQQKRNMARANRLSGLIELVDDEVISRFSAEPESFDNDQLLNYMTKTQQAINNMEQQLTQQPAIQINNTKNEVFINNNLGLDRDSRINVMNAINKILNKEDNIIDVDVDREEEYD